MAKSMPHTNKTATGATSVPTCSITMLELSMTIIWSVRLVTIMLTRGFVLSVTSLYSISLPLWRVSIGTQNTSVAQCAISRSNQTQMSFHMVCSNAEHVQMRVGLNAEDVGSLLEMTLPEHAVLCGIVTAFVVNFATLSSLRRLSSIIKICQHARHVVIRRLKN